MDYLKKSRIEEVLIAILGKGSVTSQLISRIEKILDAIRVKGSYDGIVMSEVEEILVCILLGERFEKPTHSRIAAMLKVKANGGEYTELRKSRVEDLIFEWINAVESATYIGTLPATLRTVEGHLESYKIYGNTVQDGTPTPENPIMPSGCGERTENLFDVKANNPDNGYAYGKQVTLDGSVDTFPQANVSEYISITPFSSYTFTYGSQYNDVYAALYNAKREFVRSIRYNVRREITFYSQEDENYLRFTYLRSKGDTVMLNSGSTALPYEPYGYKLPILSNATATDIYLGKSRTTRRIKKLVLTGEEEFNKNAASSSNYLYYRPRNALLPNSIEKTLLICNELPVTNEPPVFQIGISSNNNFNVIYVNFGADVMNAQPSGNTAEGLKEYLATQYAAGTPVTVWYVLAEPETAVVNEPLMTIGDYSDTIDNTQSTVRIPTAAGTTIIDYNGDPKPDKVELTYSKPK